LFVFPSINRSVYLKISHIYLYLYANSIFGQVCGVTSTICVSPLVDCLHIRDKHVCYVYCMHSTDLREGHLTLGLLCTANVFMSLLQDDATTDDSHSVLSSTTGGGTGTTNATLNQLLVTIQTNDHFDEAQHILDMHCKRIWEPSGQHTPAKSPSRAKSPDPLHSIYASVSPHFLTTFSPSLYTLSPSILSLPLYSLLLHTLSYYILCLTTYSVLLHTLSYSFRALHDTWQLYFLGH